jgi:hypothetical protein
VKVAAQQEPGDDRAEAAPAEAPLVEQAEVAALPARRDEAHHRHQPEQEAEDGDGDAIDLEALGHERVNLPVGSAGAGSDGRVLR